jgi:pimeloyl-ACP methyl ester carboxylesterase
MLIPGVAHCALEYYRWAVRSQARPDGQRFAAELAKPVDVPVLQLHGAADPAMLERTARASARWVAADRYHYRALPTAGHFPHQEAAPATTALIADFLTG